jgi:hypothetical protein
MALWGNRDSKSATGTIAIADTGVVTGSSTLFTTEADIGNYIRAGGVDYQIVTITSNTVCKVESGINGGAIAVVSGGTSYTLSEKPASVAASESSGSPSGKHGNSNKVFGVDIYESFDSAGRVVEIGVATAGARYLEVPTVTLTGGGGSSAAATATILGGAVTAIAMTNVGSSYETVPTVAIAKPSRTIPTTGVNTTTNVITYATHGLTAGEEIKYYHGGGTALAGLTNATSYYPGQVTANTFQLYASAALGATAVATMTIATTGVNITTNFITSAAHGLVNGAQLNYNNQGGTSITGLTSGSDYFVVNKTVDTFQLALTSGGDAIDISGTGNNSQTFASTGNYDLTGTGNNAQYFEIQAEANRATAVANVGGGNETGESPTGITHAGWVRRTTGTGGRAGRVQYETLVAMGSITGDQADDLQFQDD